MILILADPFHGHDCLILYLSAPSPSVEILHVHYMTKPLHKNPCPGGHEIYNFGVDSSLVIITKLSLSDLCLSEEKKLLTDIMHFHYMTYLARP